MTLLTRFYGIFIAVVLCSMPVKTHGAEVFSDCPSCPEMIVIPEGTFVMGQGARKKNAKPPVLVRIARPFAIGRYEVTFDEWEVCANAGACKKDPHDHEWGRGRRPIINITYDDIMDYIAWISARTGHRYRLPSEAEWEYAHRAGTTTAFPWGDDKGENLGNCRDCGSPWSGKGTAPVGSFLPNAFGLYDTVGNAFEWLSDCWIPSHAGRPADATPRTHGDCGQRVIRGGSFYYFSPVSHSSYRSKNAVNIKSYWLSFRLARDLR